MTFGFVKPYNSIVVDDNGGGRKPLIMGLKIETAATMYPGRLVIKGTNDDDIVVCGAGGLAFGWLGYEQADPNFKPDSVDTIYTINDTAPVLYGVGFVLVASLAASQTIVKGDHLSAGAAGQVVKTVTTATVVGVAMETVTTTGSAASVMVLSFI